MSERPNLSPPKRSRCQECGRPHAEHKPHSPDSLVYKERFHSQHGRYPTWDDALAHLLRFGGERLGRAETWSVLEEFGIYPVSHRGPQ